MRISDDSYTRDMRRYDLARRMIEYEARTTTIAEWTGLTKYRIQTLFREYTHLGEHTRHRGLSPFQPAFFSRTLLHECESVALAAIELEMEIIPEHLVPEAAKSLPGLARGERLLNAFDLYTTLVPEPRISLEHAVLLAKELAGARTLGLRHCARCHGLMVIDRLGTLHEDCAFCRLEGRGPTELDRAA